jgi:cytochrome c-type biogenesis protein CcmH
MSLANALAVLALVLCLAMPLPASAGGAGLDPAQALPDPAQEARARALFKELRCVVCQSESLDDSEATLAADMRLAIRRMVSEGKSDKEIKAFLTDRYGIYVLLRPPVAPSTVALWFGPFALLLIVLVLAGVAVVRRARSVGEPPLSAKETAELDAVRTGRPAP